MVGSDKGHMLHSELWLDSFALQKLLHPLHSRIAHMRAVTGTKVICTGIVRVRYAEQL